MEANQLRIGNYIKDSVSNEIKQVETFYEHGVHTGFGKCFSFSECLPILINEEWLLKFEFKFGHKLQSFTKWKHQFVEKEYVSGYFCENGEFYFLDRWKVNSVHQLQNLYFALTGKELKIKQ